MTDEDLALREKQLREANTPEERDAVARVWEGHSLRCQAHMAQRIKYLEKECATHQDVMDVLKKIESLHCQPKFKEDPAGWFKCNWMWLAVMCAVFKYLELVPMLKEFLGMLH